MANNPDSGYSSLRGRTYGNMDNRRFETGEHVVVKKEIVVNRCRACGLDITDRHLLRIGDSHSWHLHCLRCSRCRSNLADFRTCFMRDQNTYCRRCYDSEFSSRCPACQFPIFPGSWIRRAGDCIYHLDCFVCSQCQVPLTTGESFAIVEHQLKCKDHSMKTREPDVVERKPIIEAIRAEDVSSTGSSSSDDTVHSVRCSPTRKRIRTSFADHQLDILRASFEFDQNPDTTRIQSITDMTGLTKRVTQVWFQNARSRQKRMNITFGRATARITTNTKTDDFGIAQITSGSDTANDLSYQQLSHVFNFS